MYDKILVTLDGSPIAEKVMPWVPVIATAGGASQVTLLTVVEEATPEQLKMSEGYLQNQATLLKRAWPKGFTAPNINVIAVRAPIAGVPGVILRTAEDSDIDLMVLCTHGRSGFDRWSMGSVAEKLLRGADLPLFLVRASDVPLRQPAQIKRILAPVDGSPLAEQALPHVEVLARTPGAQVTILYVEHPPASTSEGAATAGIITQQRRETLAYLKTLLPNLAAAGVAVMHEIARATRRRELFRKLSAFRRMWWSCPLTAALGWPAPCWAAWRTRCCTALPCRCSSRHLTSLPQLRHTCKGRWLTTATTADAAPTGTALTLSTTAPAAATCSRPAATA